MCRSAFHWPLSLGRLLATGALLVGISACDENGDRRAAFDLNPSPLPTNLISNGSLEASSSELTGWSAYTTDGSAADATFSIDTAQAYRGNNSFKATITALGDQPFHIEAGPAGVPVSAGETYALVAWTKGPVGGKANFTAALGQDPWTTLANREVAFSGAWEQVAFTFTLPEDLEVTAIRFPVQLNFEGNAGADIFIDDMQLIPTDPLPPPPVGRIDLVINGGLEASATSADNWGSSSNGVGAAGTTFSVDSTEAYEGENSFKISVGTVVSRAGGGVWDIEAGPTGVPVTEGQTYTLSAWVKGTAGAKLNFNVQLPSDPWYSYATKEVVVASEWQQVTFDAHIAEASTIPDFEGKFAGPATEVRLYVHAAYLENTGAEIYIDNVQFLTQNPELVTNGGLEASDSAADGWGSGAGETGTTFSVTSEEARTGNNSFLIDFGVIGSGANEYDVEAGPLSVPVTEGQTYVFSAWIKGTPGATALFNVQLTGTPFHVFEKQTVDVTSDWQQVTFDVLIADASTINGYTGPTTAVRLFVHMGYAQNSGYDIFIDDVSLTLK